MEQGQKLVPKGYVFGDCDNDFILFRINEGLHDMLFSVKATNGLGHMTKDVWKYLRKRYNCDLGRVILLSLH